MNQNLDPNLIMILVLVLFIVMMWMSSRRMKKQQKQQQEELRESLVPGTLVVLAGGIIGTIVSVDKKYEEVVVDSEGSRIRVKLQSVRGKYVRPAFIDDDDVQQATDEQPADPESDGDAETVDAQGQEEPKTVESSLAIAEDGESGDDKTK
ncbi:preprotein translocase subunit YajC [Bifidobacterium thermophilum]|uniref:preprotein translocase subunit YajC n=1 Tax=Bifidobacterium thermophilum TaxID=33905 RepID=UPI0030B3FEFC